MTSVHGVSLGAAVDQPVILAPGNRKSSTDAAAHGGVDHLVDRQRLLRPRSTSATRARVAGWRGVNSVQQS